MNNNTALTSSLSFLAPMPIGLIVFALACSGEKEPFDIHARAMTPAPKRISVDVTPTPTALIAAAEANSVARGQAQAASLFALTKGTIRIGERSDKPNQFVNALAGYILVYGYDWTVELVAIEGHSYRDAFGAAEIDVLLDLDRAAGGDWYDNATESGVLADVGSITDSHDDSRIVVRGGLIESAPEVVEFLNLVKPTDDLVAKLSASITSSRVGIKPIVAALKYLKEHEDIWMQWVTPVVAARVSAAIEAGKTSLVNRKCIPTGGASDGAAC